MIELSNRQKLVNEILIERNEQSEKYSHSHDYIVTIRQSWYGIILSYLKDIKNHSLFRVRLVQIAALCISAIESHDRIYGVKDET